MQNLKVPLIFLFTVIMVAACTKKSGNPPSPPADKNTIYVAGYVFKGTDSNSYAAYWKNGIETLLTDGTANSTANAIAVSGNDVYIAGYMESTVGSGGSGIGYWKNGIAVPFSDVVQTNAIAIAGSDVYVAGIKKMYLIAGKDTLETYFPATYWKNGGAVSLPLGTNAVYNAIAVSGSDVYIAGGVYSGNNNIGTIATYWKNGTAVSLTDGTHDALANAIAIVGNDVYVAGVEELAANTGVNNTSNEVAKYWKNGAAVTLTDGSNDAHADAIAVSGADVYVSGYDGNIATYWKNGIAVKINSDYPSEALAIAIAGTDIYVAGYNNSATTNATTVVATYWKNGTAIGLSNDNSSWGTAIVVINQ